LSLPRSWATQDRSPAVDSSCPRSWATQARSPTPDASSRDCAAIGCAAASTRPSSFLILARRPAWDQLSPFPLPPWRMSCTLHGASPGRGWAQVAEHVMGTGRPLVVVTPLSKALSSQHYLLRHRFIRHHFLNYTVTIIGSLAHDCKACGHGIRSVAATRQLAPRLLEVGPGRSRARPAATARGVGRSRRCHAMRGVRHRGGDSPSACH
jgi:hypothetical protein